MYSKDLGIIGVGNMGNALLRGILNASIINKSKIIIYDINDKLLSNRSQEVGVDKANSNRELVQKSKYILIAVKPQVINSVLEDLDENINDGQIIISIAAGVTINQIKSIIKKEIGIVRVMPNTPALVGSGASVLSHNNKFDVGELEFIKKMLSAVGLVLELEEKHLDAVTGLSGSGPAYVFVIIKALAEGGVKMGLPHDISLKLAAQTVLGAAKMVLETNEHPEKLKDMVTSPGGTTVEGLHMLEKGNIRGTLINAVEAATEKSRKLASKK